MGTTLFLWGALSVGDFFAAVTLGGVGGLRGALSKASKLFYSLSLSLSLCRYILRTSYILVGNLHTCGCGSREFDSYQCRIFVFSSVSESVRTRVSTIQPLVDEL